MDAATRLRGYFGRKNQFPSPPGGSQEQRNPALTPRTGLPSPPAASNEPVPARAIGTRRVCAPALQAASTPASDSALERAPDGKAFAEGGEYERRLRGQLRQQVKKYQAQFSAIKAQVDQGASLREMQNQIASLVQELCRLPDTNKDWERQDFEELLWVPSIEQEKAVGDPPMSEESLQEVFECLAGCVNQSLPEMADAALRDWTETSSGESGQSVGPGMQGARARLDFDGVWDQPGMKRG